MASIYIHYPFCRKACSYCNYYFSTSKSNHLKITGAILKEIELRKEEVKEPIKSIYFGGGTPSLMTVSEIQQVLNKIHQLFSIHSNAEITFETNPDDINKKYLQDLKTLGINRLSLGIQSFNDEELNEIGRIHDGKIALESLKSVADEFENFSIDLIYGLVHSTLESWESNLNKAMDHHPKHFSLYILTVEPHTLLHHQVKHNRIKLPDDELIFDQYKLGTEFLENNGYQHYEISSFAIPQWESKHNTSYWNNSPYWGFGPSAHSFDGLKTRSWNVANNYLYFQSIQDGKCPQKKEVLTEINRFNEYLMISLRTCQGVDLNWIKSQWGDNIHMDLIEKSAQYIELNLMTKNHHRLKLSKNGKIIADRIVSDLFRDSNPAEIN